MSDLTPICRFAYEAGFLKRLPRAGWLVAGVPGRVESVAEHSHRVSLLAHVIATAEGGNPDRAATLGTYHDLPETRIGDVPYAGRRYVTTVDPNQVVADQMAGLPQPVAEAVRGAVAEFEAGQTLEAACARDADKLDCLIQALEYQDGGSPDLSAWIESSLARLRTVTAKRLAEDARVTPPAEWWRAAEQG